LASSSQTRGFILKGRALGLSVARRAVRMWGKSIAALVIRVVGTHVAVRFTLFAAEARRFEKWCS
jgi:hypothetical protein